MQYQRLNQDQKDLRFARMWIWSKASQIQSDRGWDRPSAIREARKLYSQYRKSKRA